MGALFFSGALLHALTRGGFIWPMQTTADALKAAADVTFLALWFSSFHLEIWTLDPCRKLDSGGEISDREAYEAAADKVTTQAWVNVTLFALVGVLSVVASKM